MIVLIRDLEYLTRIDHSFSKAKFNGNESIDILAIFDFYSRHHFDFLHGCIMIGKIEEGQNMTDVAKEFDVIRNFGSKLWKSFQTHGMSSKCNGGGRLVVQLLQKISA